jgi:uncharacterized protein YyaL (SSP411 family)
MDRSGYSVFTSVAAVLCLFAVATKLLAPRIPPRPINRMGKERDEYLRQGRRQQVDWRTVTADSAAEARRSGKPILLLIAVPTSRLGTYLDREVFTDPEVAGYLQRNFTCMRVDAAVHPEWLNALWPLNRLDNWFQPDFQMWALDSEGRPFRVVARQTGDEDLSVSAMLPLLFNIHRQFDSLSGGSTNGLMTQASDQGALRSPVYQPIVRFDDYSHKLLASMNDSDATGPSKRFVTLTPQVLRYLLAIGDIAAYEASVRAIVRSPMYDLLDGGFFTTLIRGNVDYVEFDKQTSLNADMMFSLALGERLSSDRSIHRAAESCWRYLSNYARSSNGFVQGQFGEEGPKHRSRRYSVSTRRCRESLDPAFQTWARQNLGLEVMRFPQAVPFLEQDVIADSRTYQVMDQLRATPGSPPVTVEAGLADISLSATARAIQCARLWRNNNRLTLARSWLQELENLRVGNDVRRRLFDDQAGLGYLGDYLAYADARLQAFLTTGKPWSFNQGLAVLKRADALFDTKSPGVYDISRPDQVLPFANLSVPEIADNLHESCTARVVRLMWNYGRLLGPSKPGDYFRNIARSAVHHFSIPATGGGTYTAAFFVAAAAVRDPAMAIAVGPDALNLANQLYRLIPTRLVAPALGPVRPDLQKRAPGIYIVDTNVVGPMTISEAARRLGPILRVNVQP